MLSLSLQPHPLACNFNNLCTGVLSLKKSIHNMLITFKSVRIVANTHCPYDDTTFRMHANTNISCVTLFDNVLYVPVPKSTSIAPNPARNQSQIGSGQPKIGPESLPGAGRGAKNGKGGKGNSKKKHQTTKRGAPHRVAPFLPKMSPTWPQLGPPKGAKIVKKSI